MSTMTPDGRRHDRFAELAAAALDFRLAPADAAELEGHLAGCASCARIAASLRADTAALRRPVGLLPSRRVDDAVYAAIAGRDPRASSSQRMLVLVAATVLLLVALLGVAAAGAFILRAWPTLPTVVVPPPSAPAVVVDASPAPNRSPAPEVTTKPPASPVRSPVVLDPASAQWAWVSTPSDAVVRELTNLVGVEGGYVALGSPDAGPAVSFSADGVSWEATPLARMVPNCPDWGPAGDEDVPDAEAWAIATNGREVVVVGAELPYDDTACTNPAAFRRPVAWHSPDGRTWQRSAPFEGGLGGSANAVWPVPGGWQGAVGQVGDAAPTIIWESADGLTWQRLGEVAADGEGGASGAAAADDGTVVLGTGSELRASPDGRAWEPLGEAGGCAATTRQVVPPSRSGLDAWALVADLRLCTSADLTTWTSRAMDYSPGTVAQTRYGLIVVGDACYGAGATCKPDPRAELTTDGATWASLPVPPLPSVGMPVDGPAGVLMIVPSGGDGAARQVWRLVPQGSAASPVAAEVAMPVIRDFMSAEEVVVASQEVHRNPRPFTLSTTFGPPETYRTNWYTACGDLASPEDRAQIYWRYYYDGTSFRQECRYGGGAYVGGLEVQGPGGHGIWGDPTWKIVEPGFLGRPDGIPLATPLWLNWLNVGAMDDPAAGTQTACPAWELGAIEEVAGRPAQVVACGTERYWIDRASGLLVKRERDGSVLIEASQLAIGRPDVPGLFTIHDDGASTELVAGAAPLPVTLPRAGGGSWSSESLRGRPAAILIQGECLTPPECLQLEAFVAVVTERSNRLNAAAVSLRGGISSLSITKATQAGIPVAVDDESGWPRWSQDGLVLFGADGRVVAVVNPQTRAALEAAVDALLAGREIPEDPAPSPPWQGFFAISRPAPDLRGLLVRDGRLSMDTFHLSSLAGRPAVVMVVPQPESDPNGSSLNEESISRAVATFGGLRRELGSRAAFVLVAGSSATSEALATWARVLATAGISDRDVTVLVPGETSGPPWSRLTMRLDPPAMSEAAMVVVDGEGVVRRIDADGLPTAADLSPVLEGLLR
jgi:hypothetical protein